MVRNRSATPLEAIQVVLRGPVADVWLRRNIVEVEDAYDDGTAQVMWEADEVSGTVPAGAVAEIEGDFDVWWQKLEEGRMTDRELVEHRTAQLSDTLASSLGGSELAFATDNHAVGTYLIHDGTLWRVTSAIAKGERIREGINVMPTSVAAELIALQEQRG